MITLHGTIEEQESELTIEQMFDKLEKILKLLEAEDGSLEDSFRYFEQGMKLVKQCSSQIDQVEKKIFVLSEDRENGRI